MRIEESVTIDAPRERVWELVKDPAGYAALLQWAEFTPAGDEREPGIGARYEMHVEVGSAAVGGLVEVVEYDPGCDIAWTSVTGVEQRGRVRLRSAPDERTRLTMRMSYGAPGVLLGTIAELLSVRRVSASIKRGLRNITCEAEGKARPASGGPGLPRRVLHELDNVRILARAGIVAPMRPDRIASIAMIGARWGASLATEVLIGAVRHPERTMLIDELGERTYRQADERSNALANALADEGIKAGDRVGLMCRDHRGFVEAAVGLAKLGADTLLLNTSFSATQLVEVCEREEAAALIYDEEFAELTEKVGTRRRFVAWREQDSRAETTLTELIENGSPASPSPPPRTGRVTILTSGTSGTPKGASRTSKPKTLDPPAALLERIPLRDGDVVRIGAPLFHTWGLANFALGMALGSTFVLRREFDPEECLADIEQHPCNSLVVVPVMLQRILDLPAEVKQRYDTSSLRTVCASGSVISGGLANSWMDEFGDNLYNLYGSTEVASATVATPKDMRRAPGTAGKPTRGTTVRLYDDRGRPVPQGETGRIFVGSAMLFEGYTGGGSKDQIDGLMASGDLGRFDEAGRLFVEGRDDEMIVSGGENVFPQEVEEVLATHDAVADVAAIGVEDKKFGQRLRAFVVLQDGQQASEDDLKKHVKANLARYKVPREVAFVDELPRNPTGKVLKRELATADEELDDG